MPITARPSATSYSLRRQQPATYVEDTMREWLIFGVGAVIGLTIGILVGEVLELSRIMAKIYAIGGAFFGACLAMGIGTKAGWVKPLSDNT